MRLYQDLYSCSGVLLVKKNALLTPAVIRGVRKKGEAHTQKRILLRKTFVFVDFKKAIKDKRYATIFRPPIGKYEICRVAGNLMLEEELLAELASMKANMPYTYQHVLFVAAFSLKIALNYPKSYYDRGMVAHCGFTHDLGKARMPLKILNKNGRLAAKERAIIETHPAVGYILLNYYLKRDRRDCALANLDHHERSDGSGYPNGIRKIQRYARLISVADMLDALMTKRPYRLKPFSLRATLDYLTKQADEKKLDRKIVRMLIRYARRKRPDLQTMKISRRLREPIPEELSHDKYR